MSVDTIEGYKDDENDKPRKQKQENDDTESSNEKIEQYKKDSDAIRHAIGKVEGARTVKVHSLWPKRFRVNALDEKRNVIKDKSWFVLKTQDGFVFTPPLE